MGCIKVGYRMTNCEKLKELRPDLPDDVIDECISIYNNLVPAGLISSPGAELAGLRKERGND